MMMASLNVVGRVIKVHALLDAAFYISACGAEMGLGSPLMRQSCPFSRFAGARFPETNPFVAFPAPGDDPRREFLGRRAIRFALGRRWVGWVLVLAVVITKPLSDNLKVRLGVGARELREANLDFLVDPGPQIWFRTARVSNAAGIFSI